ncbi:MAG: hypothetical protein H0U67_00540, partial [Gemmatimonadetes bacterium]|nr:hypothetical protein [Gemmatimonadota bacterium]
VGRNTGELGGSEYLKVIHGLVAGDAPELDLHNEKALQQALLSAIRTGTVHSAHDTSEGGLAVALAESCIGDGSAPLGLDVDVMDDLPTEQLLFGESQTRVIVSCAPEKADQLITHFTDAGVPASQIGIVGARKGQFRIGTASSAIQDSVADLAEIYFNAIPRRMDGTPEAVDALIHSEVSL